MYSSNKINKKQDKNKNKTSLMIAYAEENANPIFKEAPYYEDWNGWFL